MIVRLPWLSLGGTPPLGDWVVCSVTMPPDDHEQIELRFGRDPMAIITTGRVVRRIHEIFGPPVVPLYWRIKGRDQ